MTNRLQFRRGTSDALTLQGTLPGEPLFNTNEGKLYVSDGTTVHDVVLEGVRSLINTYDGSRPYSEDAQTIFNGLLWRATRGITPADPNPGTPNSGWERIGYTEDEIRTFANQQTLTDTTTVHLDISRGSYTGPLDLFDGLALGEDPERFVAILYNPIADVVQITIDRTGTVDANRFIEANSDDRLIAINQSADDRSAGDSDGNVVSVFAATDMNLNGNDVVVLEAHPFPVARRYLMATTGANPATLINDDTSQFNGFFYRQEASVSDFRIFRPVAEGHIVVYDRTASELNGSPAIRTIRPGNTFPENPEVGSTVVLSSAVEHEVNLQAYNGIFNGRIRLGDHGSPQPGIFNLGFTPTSIHSADFVRELHLENTGNTLDINNATANTYIPFLPITQDVFSHGFVSSTTFSSLNTLRNTFDIGDIVRLPSTGNTDFFVKEFRFLNPQFNNDMATSRAGVPYIVFSNFENPDDIRSVNTGIINGATLRRGSISDTGRNDAATWTFANATQAATVHTAILTQAGTSGANRTIRTISGFNQAGEYRFAMGNDESNNSHVFTVARTNNMIEFIATSNGEDVRILDRGGNNRTLTFTDGAESNTSINVSHLYFTASAGGGGDTRHGSLDLDARRDLEGIFRNYSRAPDYVQSGLSEGSTNLLIVPVADRIERVSRLVKPGLRVFDGITWR